MFEDITKSFYKQDRLHEQVTAASSLRNKCSYLGNLTYRDIVAYLEENPNATYFGISNERFAAMAIAVPTIINSFFEER